MRWRTILAATLMATTALATAIGTAAPAAATEAEAKKWKCEGGRFNDPEDAGGKVVYAKCRKGSATVMARFDSYGEHLEVTGKGAIAHLSVAALGTATFHNTKNKTDFNQSYPEGRSVAVQVCTSGKPSAVCTGTVTGGIT